MADWPSSLPQQPLRDGLSFQHPNGLLSTPMDQGPPKVRRKFTRAHRPMQCMWIMTLDQMHTLQTFIDVDLAGGALTFTMPDPNNPPSGTCNARFDPNNLPTYQPEEPNLWLVSTSLLVLAA